jgi:hypothetical protein
VTDLERRLNALARDLDLPEAPHLIPRVLARLAEPAALGRGSRRPRVLVIAVAALAAAAAAAFMVPQARTAILDWLGLGGVTIERVVEPPDAPAAGAGLGLGFRVSLTEARRRAGYELALPSSLGPPGEVYFTAALPGGQVAVVYPRGDSARPAILFTEFRADGLELIGKTAGPETTIEPVTVAGEPGVWLAGEPHSFVFRDPDGEIREETFRLAGNVLLWRRGDLTLRLEGVETKEEALRIAESAR